MFPKNLLKRMKGQDMARTVKTQYEANLAPGAIWIEALEPITLVDRVCITVLSGDVVLDGTCDAIAKGRCVVVARDNTRVTIPRGQHEVIVYASQNAEIDAQCGYVYATDYARIKLSGRASCEVSGHALVATESHGDIYVAEHGPTVWCYNRAATLKFATEER